MTSSTPPQAENRFLVDPTHAYTDPKLAAILELDQHIHQHPDAAFEVVAGCGQDAQFDSQTPHYHIARALHAALGKTRQGVTMFNSADPDTYDQITEDDQFIGLLQERRLDVQRADTLARQAALRGLKLYINSLKQPVLQ